MSSQRKSRLLSLVPIRGELSMHSLADSLTLRRPSSPPGCPSDFVRPPQTKLSCSLSILLGVAVFVGTDVELLLVHLHLVVRDANGGEVLDGEEKAQC